MKLLNLKTLSRLLQHLTYISSQSISVLDATQSAGHIMAIQFYKIKGLAVVSEYEISVVSEYEFAC